MKSKLQTTHPHQENLLFSPPQTREELERFLEFCRYQGFCREWASFPVLSREEGLPLPETLRDLASAENEEGFPTGYHPAPPQAAGLPAVDFRKQRGLEALFSAPPYFADNNQDGLADEMPLCLLLPEAPAESLVFAAGQLAFRLGMETTAYSLPILGKRGEKRPCLELQEGETCCFFLEGERVILQGRGAELEKFSSWICEHFPLLEEGRTWSDLLMEMVEDACGLSVDGELAYCHPSLKKCSHGQEKSTRTAYLSPVTSERMALLQEIYPTVHFRNAREAVLEEERSFSYEWELDHAKRVFREQLSSLQAGDEVEVLAVLSEPPALRQKLRQEWLLALEQRGIHPGDVEVYCTHKQGYSWLSEKVLPALEGKRVSAFYVYFKPFLPEGETSWGDEDGAVPSYTNLNASDPKRWYDLPLRYLQELYPIADDLQRRLGLKEEEIFFLPATEGQESTYLCRAYAEAELIYEARYTAFFTEQAYLSLYPEMGLVHPPTGRFILRVNGETRLQQRLLSDVEHIWRDYQEEILPGLKRRLDALPDEEKRHGNQPFFTRLELEISASEPNERLASREDLWSSLDALHEDLYFVGDDFFKNYGMRTVGKAYDAPGLILPRLRQEEGPPRFTMRLYRPAQKRACLVFAEGEEEEHIREVPVYSREEVGARLTALVRKSGEVEAEISFSGVSPAFVSAYAQILEHAALEKWAIFPTELRKLCLVLEGQEKERLRLQLPPRCPPSSESLSISEIDLHEEEVIGYEEAVEIFQQLRQVPGLAVYPLASSYMGRRVYAIEFIGRGEGYHSRVKQLSRRPSLIINARHHANEVSSTNAAFLLLRRLLTDPVYTTLPEELNLALIPVENVDGTALHHELQQENPYWKLHAARFNALGKEFYYDLFQWETRHTEALALTRLYHRFLPDILVDNHGVPSHEWEQVFSGYTSPAYKGFWLPRALLYGYFWYVSNPEYEGNVKVNQALQEVIADRLQEDKELSLANQAWRSSFERYAHRWMPRLFPASYYREMINYWISYAYDATHRYPSIRFPWLTTVCYTSEVADETAQGAYLGLCARAHLCHDLAIIDWLRQAESVYENTCKAGENTLSVRYRRYRPLHVTGETGENP